MTESTKRKRSRSEDDESRKKRRINSAKIRGIFAWEDEESPEWKDAIVNIGKNRIPKFETKEDCQEFIRKNCWRGSNPKYPHLQHIFTMLIDWEQIETILIPKIKEYDERYPPQKCPDISKHNQFVKNEIGKKVLSGVNYRMQLPFHQLTNRESTYNTLRYLFFHMRCGIFVMIRQKKVVLFVPFANKDYENNWSHNIEFDTRKGPNTMKQYYYEKQSHYRKENIIDDISKWWANGNIICNEHNRYRNQEHESQYWGDQFLTQLRDMLEDACSNREIADCEFFINKRDYPHLKENLSEPYGFLFNKDDRNPADDIPLTDYRYATYAPIMSFYVSKRFADIPFPCSEDWEAATGLVFPPSFKHTHCRNCRCGNLEHCKEDYTCFCKPKDGRKLPHGIEDVRDLFTETNFENFQRQWKDKKNTAFFRGSATGGGTTIETNQRLHLAHLSNEWKNLPEFGGQPERKKDTNSDIEDVESKEEEVSDDVPIPFLDAAVTTWNLRDKKIAGGKMTFLRDDDLNFEAGRQHYIPIYDQTKYKYILYVEGHCAANRYAFLMRLGSVILKVESRCVADEMWFFPILVAYEDHVPVKSDLSDLAEKIQWCRDHDEECKKIVERAAELYRTYVSKEAIHDYIELVCHNVAKNFLPAPKWYTRPNESLQTDTKHLDGLNKPNFEKRNSGCMNKGGICKHCEELKEDESQIYRQQSKKLKRYHEFKKLNNHTWKSEERNKDCKRQRDRSFDRGEGGYNKRPRLGDRTHDNNHTSSHYREHNNNDNRNHYDNRDHGYSHSYHGGRNNHDGGHSDNYHGSRYNRQSSVPHCRKCRRSRKSCICR